MTCAGRGVSLAQRRHRAVMFQGCFVTWHFVSQRLRTPLITPMPATALRGTGLLHSLLRKACALSCASPSTAESELNSAVLFDTVCSKYGYGPVCFLR